MSSSASSARNAAIHATPQQTPPSLKRKASDLSFSTPPPSKTSRIRGTQATATRGPLEIKVRMPVTMPPSPPLSEGEAPTDLVRSISPPPPSPDLCSSSPELSKLALYIDEATGEANLSASSPNSASLPSLSYGSSSASSSDSFGSFGSMSNTSGVTGPSSYVVKANVPGIGRCIFQRSVLLAKLGEEAAHKAISAAEALTLRRSPLFDGKPGLWRTGSLDSSRNGTPAPVVGAAVRSAELVRRWLEQDKDGEEVEEATLRQGTFFLPGQAYPSMDDEEDWYAKEDSEDFVVSQGGKSIRVLRKRNKDLNDPSRPRSRTSSNRSGKHGGDGAVTCVCKQPDQDCDMVQCDSCRGWFHLHCLEIASIDDIPQDRDWFCYRCSGGPMPHVRVSSFKNRRPLNYHPLPDWHNQPTGIPCPPMLVQSSPHIPRAASFGLFNPHLTLHGSNPATPLQSGQQSHTRSDKRSTHLWYQSQTPYSGRPDPASYVSYSPKTPAVGSVVEPRSRIPSFNLDSYYNDEALIGTEGYLGNGWHNPCGMQTPSRSAGVSLAHDWSYPMPTSFKRNTSASSAHQDFFQKLHTATPKQHVTFESPSAGSPLPNRSTHQRVRSGQSHLSNSPFLGQPHPRHSAIKLAPPAMARAGSGLGIGFGDGAFSLKYAQETGLAARCEQAVSFDSSSSSLSFCLVCDTPAYEAMFPVVTCLRSVYVKSRIVHVYRNHPKLHC